MKYLLLSFIFLALNCAKPTKTVEKEKTKKPNKTVETITTKEKIVETKKMQEELIVVIKDINNIEDAKALIVNSGLTWNSLAIDTKSLKAASIKVPVEKKDFWIQRLQDSNVFSSVEINEENTLKELKYIAENTFVKLRKTHCSGDCPVYDVTFFKDGKVVFNGIENVLITGKQEFTVTEKQLKKLIQMFGKTTFTKYKNAFVDTTLADFPSTFITHQNKQIEIKLWKNVPDELAFAHEYLEEILLEKKLIE